MNMQLYRGSNLLMLFFSLFKIDALLKLWRQEGLRGLYKVRDCYDSLNWVTCKQAQCGRQFTTKQSKQNSLHIGQYLLVHRQRLADMFRLRSQIHNRQTRSSGALDIPLCRLSTGQRSFAFRGAKLWKSLNDNIKSLKCPKNFRRHFVDVLLG